MLKVATSIMASKAENFLSAPKQAYFYRLSSNKLVQHKLWAFPLHGLEAILSLYK